MPAQYLGPLPGHGRFDYRPITRRPAYRWPNGTGLAVYLGFNIEHFAFGLDPDLLLIEREHFAIVSVAAAVDDEEVASKIERQQRVVPRAARQIHALPRTCHEAAQRIGSRCRPGSGHDNKEALRRQRHEKLAAELVALDELQLQRQRVRLGAKDVDQRAPAAGRGVDLREVVIALDVAVVDGVVRAAGFDDLAERCKGRRMAPTDRWRTRS